MTSFAPHYKDCYKISHISQYKKGTTRIYSNFTARSGEHSNIPGSKGIYFVGLQYFILEYLIKEWNNTFFLMPKDIVVKKYQRRVSHILGYEVNVDHISALHDLGYLPVIIKGLPEGSFIPYNVPMLTIQNTLDDFFWVTNMLESVMSAELWQPITSATTYMGYKEILTRYADLTGASKDFIPYQAHDFSFRGMAGRHAAAISGFAVLAAGGVGTDCIPAIDIAEDYYGAHVETEIVGQSVNATEHSVCSSNIITDFTTDEFSTLQDEFFEKKSWDHHASGLDYKLISEYGFVKNLILNIYPDGIVSNVSDTFDFWNNISEILPRLKDEIMTRNGKYVCRPDSGNPVRVICGDDFPILDYDPCLESLETLLFVAKQDALEWIVDDIRENTDHGEMGPMEQSQIFKWNGGYYKATVEIEWNRHDKQYYYMDGEELIGFDEVFPTAEQKGLIECLWEIFGGTVNAAGFKELDSHIGAIYGDSITLDRAEAICSGLMKKGFASSNVVLGVGSMSFQLCTRDTHGMAMKATNAVINGESVAIFKDPKTGSGKKSAKGLLMVTKDAEGYHLEDEVDSKAEKRGCLETVFKDGKLGKFTTLKEIRESMAN